ncbi:hypothetical protein B0H19DRAFT_564622 [Mycena capillaripes]|nr:hypothetical protein B0H19DRAFT_564622 [Mycena capillaripes]
MYRKGSSTILRVLSFSANMSSSEDRFRIPGGSLDLDFDEGRDGTTEVNLLPSPQPPPTIQSIAHLTPADVSCVLSRLSHPLASRTAEYVQALNISGAAFRNLDLSALNILANHDPAMSDELLRIRAGVLPPVPPPAGSIIQGPDSATLNSLSSNVSDPAVAHSFPSPTPLSSDSPFTQSTTPSPPNCAEIAATASETETEPASQGNSSDDTDGLPTGRESSTDPYVAAPTADTGNLSPSSLEDGAADDDSSAKTTTEQATATAAAGELVTDTNLCPSTPSTSAPSTLPPPIGTSSETLPPNAPDVLVGTRSENAEAHDSSEARSFSESSISESSDRKASNMQATHIDEASGNSLSAPTDGSTSGDISVPGGQTIVAGDPSSSKGIAVEGAQFDKLMDSNSGTSPAGASSDGSTATPAPAKGRAESVETDQDTLADRGSSESYVSSLDPSGAISKPEGPAEPEDANIPTAPIHVSRDETVGNTSNQSSPDSNPTPLMSFSPLQRDLDTPASGGNTDFSALETPRATTDPAYVGDPSFLEFDLLHFSPFSVSAQLAHDEEMPLTELFKANTYPSAPTRSKDAFLMTGGSENQSGMEPASDGEIAPSNLSFAPSHAATPFCSTTGSHSATAAPGAEGVSLFLPENSHGTGSPAFFMNEFATRYVHNQANHEGPADLNLCSGLEKAVDHCSLPNVGDCSGACDDESLARITAGLDPSSPARLRAPCVVSSVDIGSDPTPIAEVQHGHNVSSSPSRISSGDPESTGGSNLPMDSSDQDSSTTKSVRETRGVEAGRLPGPSELRPPVLALTIPISPTSLEEELSQLSPLFSPIGSDQPQSCSESTTFERLFSERAFSVPRSAVEMPVKLKRGARMRRARDSRGTDTSDLALPATKRVLVDASVQTDEDMEGENMRRRIKALERELRSLRAIVRRSEDRVRESKPKSFWKKVAATDRIVPPPEPVRFGLLKDISWNFSSVGQGNSGVATSS